jgi:hypothetical protein
LKKLALAAMIAAFGVSAAQASTTITLYGFVNQGDAYTTTVADGHGTFTYDDDYDVFAAQFTFDLSAFSGSTDPSSGYYGTAFSFADFANFSYFGGSSTFTPFIVTSGTPGDTIIADSDSITVNYGRTLDGIGGASQYTSYSVFGDGPVPLTMIDGVVVPDFSQIDPYSLSFIYEDHDGTGSNYVNHDATGFIFDIEVSTTSDAPEPASWAMMVGGFGLIGGAMRRRRTVQVRFG